CAGEAAPGVGAASAARGAADRFPRGPPEISGGGSARGRGSRVGYLTLALTAVGFARLCIAATRVDPRERGVWLETMAAKLEALCEDSCELGEDERSPVARRSSVNGSG